MIIHDSQVTMTDQPTNRATKRPTGRPTGRPAEVDRQLDQPKTLTYVVFHGEISGLKKAVPFIKKEFYDRKPFGEIRKYAQF